jgi:hypothetical protein
MPGCTTIVVPDESASTAACSAASVETVTTVPDGGGSSGATLSSDEGGGTKDGGGGCCAAIGRVSVSVKDGHAAPPFAAAVNTVRVRVRLSVPSPFGVHADHADHAETTQSTTVAIGRVSRSTSDGQAVPPLAGAVNTVRVLVRLSVPSPFGVHADHADHAETTQLTGTGAGAGNGTTALTLFEAGLVPLALIAYTTK